MDDPLKKHKHSRPQNKICKSKHRKSLHMLRSRRKFEVGFNEKCHPCNSIKQSKKSPCNSITLHRGGIQRLGSVDKHPSAN